MGGCIVKDKGSPKKDPVVVTKKSKRVPSLSSIEENQLYKTRIDKERKDYEDKAFPRSDSQLKSIEIISNDRTRI